MIKGLLFICILHMVNTITVVDIELKILEESENEIEKLFTEKNGCDWIYIRRYQRWQITQLYNNLLKKGYSFEVSEKSKGEQDILEFRAANSHLFELYKVCVDITKRLKNK